jgi:hypothetical protein
VLAKRATGLACPDASTTGCVDHDNPTHYNSSFAQVDGNAERLVCKHYPFALPGTTARHDVVTVPRCGENTPNAVNCMR